MTLEQLGLTPRARAILTVLHVTRLLAPVILLGLPLYWWLVLGRRPLHGNLFREDDGRWLLNRLGKRKVAPSKADAVRLQRIRTGCFALIYALLWVILFVEGPKGADLPLLIGKYLVPAIWIVELIHLEWATWRWDTV